MLPASTLSWRPSHHQELPLARLPDFRLLEACHRLWQESGPAGGAPPRLDPVELPRQILPMVLLLDLEAPSSRLRIRLAGTAICELYGGELRGRLLSDVLEAPDARAVIEATLALAADGRPGLAARSHLCRGDRMCSYTCLTLPLARGGSAVDSFFTAIDPHSLTLLHD